jgi:hypothetical protein
MQSRFWKIDDRQTDPVLLPLLTLREAIETTKVHSVC